MCGDQSGAGEAQTTDLCFILHMKVETQEEMWRRAKELIKGFKKRDLEGILFLFSSDLFSLEKTEDSYERLHM